MNTDKEIRVNQRVAFATSVPLKKQNNDERITNIRIQSELAR
jgi:hypothetical protein